VNDVACRYCTKPTNSVIDTSVCPSERPSFCEFTPRSRAISKPPHGHLALLGLSVNSHLNLTQYPRLQNPKFTPQYCAIS
jgi:hypothetical protein